MLVKTMQNFIVSFMIQLIENSDWFS